MAKTNSKPKENGVKVQIPGHSKGSGALLVFDIDISDEDVTEVGVGWVRIRNPSKELLAQKGVSIVKE